jgi:hypothetical protein
MRRFDLRERPRDIAENRCAECRCEWRDRPIGFARQHECPRCGSLYWEWTNYDTERR